MRIKSLLSTIALLVVPGLAVADLTPWEDYEPSQSVYYVTTIKVKPNMEDAYLEGIANTWVPGNEIAKELGQIKDYSIYRSALGSSGDFNLILVIEFEKTDDLAPNKEEYERFMAAYTKEAADAATEFSQENYPAMREITGEYYMRKIELK